MILVTGGTGLVGTHLIYALLKKGEKVRAIRRKSSKIEKLEKVISYYQDNVDELLKNLEWVYADILDVHSLEEAMEGVDKVYHSAAIISFNPSDHQRMIDNNTKGTANLVNAALNKKIKKLCHVSSIAAVGRDNTKEMVTESEQWTYSKKQSAYAISKHESEREVWRGIAEGLDAVIVNPSIIEFEPSPLLKVITEPFWLPLIIVAATTLGSSGFVLLRRIAFPLKLIFS